MGALSLSVNLSGLVAWGADAAPKQGSTAESSNVSDKELRAFSKAYVEYHKIRQNYEPKMNNTRDEKEKLKIQREGDDKVKQALRNRGSRRRAITGYLRRSMAIRNCVKRR